MKCRKETIITTEGEMTMEQFEAWTKRKKQKPPMLPPKKPDVHETFECPFMTMRSCNPVCAWRTESGCAAITLELVETKGKRCPVSPHGKQCEERCIFYDGGCRFNKGE